MRNWLLGRLCAARSDSGIVAIWTALLLVVFVGMTAIAVDISRWYVEAERVQKTVDAAALGGAVYLPGNFSGAEGAARDLVAANGLDPSAAGVEQGNSPSQLRVTYSSVLHNPFAAVLGFDTSTITRSAAADYAAPVPIGSPCNVFGGNEPVGDKWASANCPATTGRFMANIAGPNTSKIRGDAFATRYCSMSEAKFADGKPNKNAPVSGCVEPRNVDKVGPGGTFNSEYTPDGYIYIVRATKPGQLQLQGFDLAYGSRDLADMKQPYQDSSSLTTVVTVRGPAKVLGEPLSGDKICTITATMGSTTYVNKWVNLCSTINVAQAGDYSIQFTTSVPGDTQTGGGMNQYSLRARLTGGASNKDVSIFAFGRMSIFTNDTESSPKFKFVRLDSSAAGRTLVVRMFDLGDVTNPVGSIARVNAKMLWPDSDTQSFPDCTATGPTTAKLPANDCSVTLSEDEHSGLWQEIAIKIPGDYTCADDADQSKCWVQVQLTPTPIGSAILDITSWTASLEGDPVRLVP